MINKSYDCLKNDGYLVLNISNVKTFPDLVEKTKKYAKEKGFVLYEEKNLILSSISGKGKKREPILVFKKTNQKYEQINIFEFLEE